MRKIVELTDREIEEAREYGLKIRLHEEGLRVGDPDRAIEQEPIEGGTRFIQKG
jgi:hypothetical protein